MSGKVRTTWISDDIGTCPEKKVWNSVSGKYRTSLHLIEWELQHIKTTGITQPETHLWQNSVNAPCIIAWDIWQNYEQLGAAANFDDLVKFGDPRQIKRSQMFIKLAFGFRCDVILMSHPITRSLGSKLRQTSIFAMKYSFFTNQTGAVW